MLVIISITNSGTNNKELKDSSFYLGTKENRERGKDFWEFIDEFMKTVKKKWPNCLVQFEDFSNDVCFELLEKYRKKQLCFNDDIQGTGLL